MTTAFVAVTASALSQLAAAVSSNSPALLADWLTG